jgi:hypothetical protein
MQQEKITGQHNGACPIVQRQLHLFSVKGGRGNTLLDYDLVPRFWHNRHEKYPKPENGHTPHHEVTLPNGDTYKLFPAEITDDQGNSLWVYPSTRESLIEECLIDFAKNGEFSLEKGEPGYRLDGAAIGVYFTLHQLRKALRSIGKEYKASELKQGLEVLAMSRYRCHSEGGRERIRSYIVASLDSVPNDMPTDAIRGDRIMYVVFDNEASKRILSGMYRSYDAKRCMAFKSPVARFLYRQFTHVWQNANNKGESGSYRVIEQNETILASGCPLLSNPTKRKDNVLKALEELSGAGIIQPIDKQADVVKVKAGRQVVDVQFVVRPGNDFIKQQIEGYKRMQGALRIGHELESKQESPSLA